MPKPNETLCWSCRKCLPGRGCEWADRFKPVRGWNATKYIKKIGDKMQTTYRVRECPKYDKGRS